MSVWKQLFAVGKDFGDKMQRKNISVFAGSCAYFLMVSVVPLLILLSSIIPYTAVTQDDLIKVVTDLMPEFAEGFMIRLINETYQRSVAVFSLSAIATVWSGALAMLAIIRGLNAIYEVEERRNYIILRLIASVYTIAMIAIIMVMMIFMVFEKILREIAIRQFPRFAYIFSLSAYFKFVLVIGIATFAFGMIYTFVPSARMNFWYQLPGAFFSAVVWYIFSWLFSIYVSISDLSVYGSIATLLVLMMWLYFCLNIFFVGAFINKFFHPVVKVFYDDHHRKKVRENVKKKSSKRTRRHRNYSEFG